MPDVSILVTKVRIPPPSPHLIARQQLVSRLEREVPRRRLIAVAAPAGYGKTTLLAEWARKSAIAVAWLSLSDRDNDREQFLRYLLAAWAEVVPGIAESPLGFLLGSHAPDHEAVLAAFVNQGSEAAGHIAFVLDDYHVISEPAVHSALTYLIDHLPPNLHFVLSFRAEPELPIARYRARRQLFELWDDDLRFSPEETATLVERQMGLTLASDEAALLQTQTEGWAAGLQLSILGMRFRGAPERSSLSASGKNRFVADYLRSDVLAYLPEDTVRFLLQTGILERLSAPLCEAVTGEQGSQAMLERLERENLFLMPLDDRREWFRYHPLFADFLQEEVHRRNLDEVPGLHRRAARWYLSQEMPDESFHHAVAGDDVDCAVEVFDRFINIKLARGEFKLLQRWLDALPPAWMARYPVLELGRAGLLAYSGAVAECIQCLDSVEERLTPGESVETQTQLARVTAVRCFVACMQNNLAQAEALAAQALRDLPESDASFRPGIYGALGDTYRGHARWEKARDAYVRVLEAAQSPAVRFYSAHVSGALADLALRQGHLKAASDYWRKALAAVEEQAGEPSLPLPVIGWFYIRMAEILYEWNELAPARDYLTRGLKRAELGGDVRALIAGYLLAARLQLAAGDEGEAAAFLEKTRPLVEQSAFAEWRSHFERCQLELWLAQDMLRTAVNWVDELMDEPAIQERPGSEVAQLGMARVLVVKGDLPSVERAQALLSRLVETAGAEGRTGVLVEALAQRGLALWRRGDSPGAMGSLERALRLAEPEGYVRLFVDGGLPMARLIQEARSRDVMPTYVERLLTAFGSSVPAVSEAPALPEPLTAREEEVLELLAAGLSNREIGEELVISPETVKKHTSNIYGKLGVRSRTEAVARAREVDLLD
jgi:LuxR family transcriptional regulator, maltose regulon positive regulatory protein